MTPVYTNFTDSFFCYWVMRAQSPVMMDECFPERLDDDSEEEFYYNFIKDDIMNRGVLNNPWSKNENVV
jgi:hypothetical protein